MLNFLKAFFGGSKKASVVLVGILMSVFRDVLGLDPETAQSLMQLIMMYLVGQGAVDVALAAKGAKKQ